MLRSVEMAEQRIAEEKHNASTQDRKIERNRNAAGKQR
jgi:hypothetical protein